jgi:hypothetical protein
MSADRKGIQKLKKEAFSKSVFSAISNQNPQQKVSVAIGDGSNVSQDRVLSLTIG